MMGVLLLLGFSLVFLVMYSEQARDLISGGPVSVFGSALSFSAIDWDVFYNYLVSNAAGQLWVVSVVLIVGVVFWNILKTGRSVR